MGTELCGRSRFPHEPRQLDKLRVGQVARFLDVVLVEHVFSNPNDSALNRGGLHVGFDLGSVEHWRQDQVVFAAERQHEVLANGGRALRIRKGVYLESQVHWPASDCASTTAVVSGFVRARVRAG